jgi:hypothetical protein
MTRGRQPITQTVIPRARGGSSTSRLFRSIADVSGILDRPLSRAMTTWGMGRSSSHTRSLPAAQMRPDCWESFAPKTEGAGKAGCPLHPQPRVRNKKAHERSHHRFTGATRPSLHNGFTAYSALSPATNSSCHRHRRIDGFAKTRSGPQNLRRLDTSNGCQDHTASPSATRLRQEAPAACPPKL